MKKVHPLLALGIPAMAALVLVGCDKKGVAVADLPAGPPGMSADLKNDAFDYYGLGNDKPVRLEIVNGEGSSPSIATRTFTVDKLSPDKATFVEHQEGALAEGGDITLSLEKDGLYVMSSTSTPLKAHTLEMPAKLDVGGGWKDHTEMSPGGKKILLDNDIKIERKERVTTPGGTFDDALYVTSLGKGTIAGENVILTTKSWYVRGLGPVKQIEEVETKGKGKRVITIQLAAPESTAPAGGAPDAGGSPGVSSGPPPTVPDSSGPPPSKSPTDKAKGAGR